jgi:hypothetical protein
LIPNGVSVDDAALPSTYRALVPAKRGTSTVSLIMAGGFEQGEIL